jgi:retron-type reverse transcriptase
MLIKNLGLPERGNSGGSRGFVVATGLGAKRQTHYAKGASLSSCRGELPAGVQKLQELMCTNPKDPDPRMGSLVTELLSDKDLLYYAYSNIKSKPGSMTPGSDVETLDGIDSEFLDKLQREIATGSFRFKPSRTVEIPKPNGKTRKLGVASPRDKIVQELMRIILEAVFLPTFNRKSHGFVPGKSCHTALKELKGTFGDTN